MSEEFALLHKRLLLPLQNQLQSLINPSHPVIEKKNIPQSSRVTPAVPRLLPPHPSQRPGRSPFLHLCPLSPASPLLVVVYLVSCAPRSSPTLDYEAAFLTPGSMGLEAALPPALQQMAPYEAHLLHPIQTILLYSTMQRNILQPLIQISSAWWHSGRQQVR